MKKNTPIKKPIEINTKDKNLDLHLIQIDILKESLDTVKGINELQNDKIKRLEEENKMTIYFVKNAVVVDVKYISTKYDNFKKYFQTQNNKSHGINRDLCRLLL